ncbi:RNA-directed DNA polymerase [Pseudoalteromonas phenolica]|uniref:RNA-directed DNA polymerase n=1 Tax=Pseudoalteromonas phenolica TaxID=161398 RepID=A0A5R9Q239_9GAMM|nr:RNA-directed DNA polymerase [Pseudoalteromonas phenolica]TLX47220.1 RNA-directed DNA polymerase [Pseudoalteromonas phenolica]
MSKFRQYLKKSVENIIAHGDTDIFPFPIENLLFNDKQTETIDLLEKVHSSFEDYLSEYPVLHEKALQAVGYHGFRYGTQIDPLWNAYFLALVISISDEIETARIPTSKKKVFSYRYSYDKDKKYLFDREYNWSEFNKRAIELAKQKPVVLKCDISNFYPSVYHHRIENALRKATTNTESVKRIVKLLSKISKGVSYGLPVGGPAARILSELLLNRVDRLLLSEGIEFCRYADDYIIFTDSVEEAYGNLIYLCEKLTENEGLAIQKSKTQIMTSSEFLSLSEFGNPNDSNEDNIQADNFLKLRLFYDPYSPTADTDYDDLKSELEKFDIVGMLGKEISKSRINQALTRRLINSIKYLSPQQRKAAIYSLFGQRDEAKSNLDVLYPVFPSVMLLCRSIISDLDNDSRELIFEDLRNLLNNESYITKVPINLMYAVRILAHDKSEEADFALIKAYKNQVNPVITSEIILAMAQHDSDYWISDKLKSFSSLSRWEKRSLLISSYILGDEGQHWRDKVKGELPDIDTLLIKWFSERFNSNGWGTLL